MSFVDDIERLYVSRKEGRRKLASITDCAEYASTHGIQEFIKKSKEKLITPANNRIGYISTARKTIKK